MARKAIQNVKVNEHITLSECPPDSECRTVNWWLYDKRAFGGSGANIGMRAATREDAFIEAIEFWSKRAILAEERHSNLKRSVDLFVAQFDDVSDED